MSWKDEGEGEEFEFFCDPASDFLSAGAEKLPWVVDGIIPFRELAVLFGESGSMKSFVAHDLALAIATGKPWHGRPVEKSLVVLISPEGERGLPVRLRGACEGSGLTHPPVNLRVSDQIVPLNNEDALNRVLQETEEVRRDPEMLDACDYAPAKLKEHFKGDPTELVRLRARYVPVVFIIDNLTKCMSKTKFDENNAEDMNGVVKGCDILRTMGSVILIHHTDKHGKTMKGSYVLDCAAETAIRATKTKIGTTLTLEQREGLTGQKLEFVADVVPVVRAEPGTTTVRLRLKTCPDGHNPTTVAPSSSAAVSADAMATSGKEGPFVALLEARGPGGVSRKEAPGILGVSSSTLNRIRKKLGAEITTTKDGRYVLTRLLTAVA